MSCYQLIKHTCTGACQGCSDCPFAVAYQNGTSVNAVTRRDILKYRIKSWWDRWTWYLWTQMHKKDVDKIIEEICDK